ncbi:MAG: hypothetical protein CME32_16230 [Gimesia sp.]|jgi:site-specific DNA-cytosine methylase|nr:hypothetical protein [Gimesia sp.]
MRISGTKELWVSESCAGLGTGGLAATTVASRLRNCKARLIECSEMQHFLRAWLDQLYIYVGDDVSEHDSVAFVGCAEMDFWIAGFPCQGWSKSGKMEKTDDDRHVSEDEVKRILVMFRPKVLLLENVLAYKEFWDTVLVPILIEAGYSVADFQLNAENWVPQFRPRQYMIAIRDDILKDNDITNYLPQMPVGGRKKLTLESVFSQSNLIWLDVAQCKTLRRGSKVWCRNYAKSLEALDRLFKANASAKFVCTDMGSSPKQFHATVDRIMCITATRSSCQRLWVFSRTGKMAKLTRTAYGLLQGFGKSEQAQMRKHLSERQLRLSFGNAMCKFIVEDILLQCSALL